MIGRIDRFDTRDRLIVADGTGLAQPVHTDSELVQRQLLQAKLRDVADGIGG